MAKVAVLAAMYGQTSGTAADALRDMERAYPTAMRFLQSAHDDGRAGRDVLTWAGRRVRMWHLDPLAPDAGPRRVRAHQSVLGRDGDGSRATPSSRARPPSCSRPGRPPSAPGSRAEGTGEVVLCLHDELLLHVRERRRRAPARAPWSTTWRAPPARWTDAGVRFVADVAVVRRWSDAKG